jgi:hypothetical protein
MLLNAALMPSAWQKRDVAKIPRIDPFIWHGVIHRIDRNGMRAVCTRCRGSVARRRQRDLAQ